MQETDHLKQRLFRAGPIGFLNGHGARDAGWGKDIPDMLRNEDCNDAIFTLAKQHRAGVNQAECLACHKPLDKVSDTITLDQIGAAAKKR